MNWPWVSRARLNYMIAAKDEKIEDRDRQIAALDSERKKLWDIVAYTAVRIPVFNKDLIPQSVEQPEEKLTPDQELEAEFKREREAEAARLTSIARTRPSQLGPEMERAMAKQKLQRAQAANPQQHVRAIFADARTEATKQ